MLVHHSFKRIQDKIGIREGRHTFKFCGHCGYRLRGEDSYLKNHFKRFHDSKEHFWLKHGEMPKSNWYTNMADHF